MHTNMLSSFFFLAKTILKSSAGVYRIATLLRLSWDKWSCMLQRSGKRLCSSHSTQVHKGWLNLTKLSKIWNQNFYLSSHSCVGDNWRLFCCFIYAFSLTKMIKFWASSSAGRARSSQLEAPLLVSARSSNLPFTQSFSCCLKKESHVKQWRLTSMSYRWLSGAMGTTLEQHIQYCSAPLVKTSRVSRKHLFLNQGKGGVVERGGMDGGWQEEWMAGPDSKVNMLFYTTHFK